MKTKRFISAIAATGVYLAISGIIPPNTQNAKALTLSGLSNQQWDEYSSDNTRFDGIVWKSGRCRETQDERYKTPREIAQIYHNLSTAALGRRVTMTAGYLNDKSYHCGFSKWHAGYLIMATQ
ncbi:hypothetical protein [Coleofasciculus sp. E2-BRE-01]|uniref:hypothetical protein n=1 Tax=Coleofasciculus sp. E2-BRE-01 TaxID=3069524 RepID=UPI0032F4C102